MALSTMRDSMEKYVEMVKTNPLVVNEIESALRWLSYLAAASSRKNSHLVSEFLYSSANILQLLNDSILRKAANLKIHVNSTVANLQTLLQILEYTAVFTEFTSSQFASSVGKWIIISCFQIAKAVIKLVLLLKYRQGLQRSNPVLPLDRRGDLICLQRNHNANLNNNQHQLNAAAGIASGSVASGNPSNTNTTDGESIIGTDGSSSAASTAASSCNNDSTVRLKRSGRMMRTLDQAPSRGQRTWMLPSTDTRFRQLLDRNKKDAPPSVLNDQQTIGEILHILRPVAHLGAMGIFGSTAWIPYFVSLGMDLSSLKLLHEPHDKIWTLSESIELGQRSFALLLYILRSPFYDRYTKERILKTLSLLADNIPLLGRLIRPMVDYLPEWQKTYFYVWGA